jgi:hypothetical protein
MAPRSNAANHFFNGGGLMALYVLNAAMINTAHFFSYSLWFSQASFLEVYLLGILFATVTA